MENNESLMNILYYVFHVLYFLLCCKYGIVTFRFLPLIFVYGLTARMYYVLLTYAVYVNIHAYVCVRNSCSCS